MGATIWNQPEAAGQRRTGHDRKREEFPQVRSGRWLIRECPRCDSNAHWSGFESAARCPILPAKPIMTMAVCSPTVTEPDDATLAAAQRSHVAPSL
jgi:hypothetical protein